MNKNQNKPSLLIVCNDLLFDPITKELPTEIDALIEGNHGKKMMLDGKVRDVVITKDDVDAAVQYVRERRQAEPNREFVIDYEHQTLYGGEAPAAGWWNDLKRVDRNGVAIARAVISKWTPRGAERILNGEYRYDSPVFRQNSFDDFGKFQKCMIFNIGLTNEPFLKNAMPIAATKFFNLSQNILGKDTTMEELLKTLRFFLNAQDSSTPEELLASLNALSGKVAEYVNMKPETVTAKNVLDYFTQNKPVIAASGGLTQFKNNVIAKLGVKPEATNEEMLALIVAAKGSEAQLATITAELQALKDADFEKNFQLVLAKSVSSGRLLPAQKQDEKWLSAQKDWAKKDFAAFETHFCKTAPVVGPVTPLPELGEHTTQNSEDPLVIAKAAMEYQQEQKKLGFDVSASAAVQHVTKKGV